MSSGRLALFDNPLFLGFDQFEETVNRMRKATAEGYPPYNIEQLSEDALRITLAVAGFSMDELDVEIEQNQLTIRGKQIEDTQRIYLHRGIAARQFQRAFMLADGMEVQGAGLDNGLLHIELIRTIPESVAQKIEIKTTQNTNKNSKAIDVEPNKKQPKAED
ncbi:MAG: Hsp20 family protein [Alphaproteobacteria bacterium]|nr:Hsp20 family protein [Alphaproteobacteria bacterium]